MNLKRNVKIIALLAIAVLLLAGCDGSVRGGGWLPSAERDGCVDVVTVENMDEVVNKAIFGFTAKGIGEELGWASIEFPMEDYGGVIIWIPVFVESPEAKGIFNYRDKAAGVKFIGEVTHAARDTEDHGTPDEYSDGFIRGTIGEDGWFWATVFDNGEAGLDRYDNISVYAYSPDFGYYMNSNFLGGGNIQFFEP